MLSKFPFENLISIFPDPLYLFYNLNTNVLENRKRIDDSSRSKRLMKDVHSFFNRVYLSVIKFTFSVVQKSLTKRFEHVVSGTKWFSIRVVKCLAQFFNM